MGPFGIEISGVTLPAHWWSREISADEVVTPVVENGILRLEVCKIIYSYGRDGLF